MDRQWTKFNLRIPLNANVQTIYDAWATPQGLEMWFLRKAHFTSGNAETRQTNEYVQEGDTYEWLWHGYDDNATERNTVTQANGRDMLQFGFSGGSMVTVVLKAASGFTLVELTQHEIPVADEPSRSLYVACSQAWVFYLTNLKSVLEGDLDLRNRDINLKGVINS